MTASTHGRPGDVRTAVPTWGRRKQMKPDEERRKGAGEKEGEKSRDS